MIRRLMYAQLDPSFIDDRDYYGNKRLELAGVYLVQCDLSTPCGSANQLLCWLHMPQLGSPLFPLHTSRWLAACLLLLQRHQIAVCLSICTLFAIVAVGHAEAVHCQYSGWAHAAGAAVGPVHSSLVLLLVLCTARWCCCWSCAQLAGAAVGPVHSSLVLLLVMCTARWCCCWSYAQLAGAAVGHVHSSLATCP
jgi:hypothetical protein